MQGIEQRWRCGVLGHDHATLAEAWSCMTQRNASDEEKRRVEEINRQIYEKAGPPECPQ